MNKILTTLVSFIILIQSFGIGLADVVLIDEFIEHAEFHSEEYGDDVFVFISKHYGTLKAAHDQEQQEENKDHEQLPFVHHSHIFSVAAFVFHSNTETFKALEFFEFKYHNFHYQEPSSSLHSDALFQPPQFS